ncbi:MAG: S8 family serine peptidase [Cyanobacteria bacterium J06641_5]
MGKHGCWLLAGLGAVGLGAGAAIALPDSVGPVGIDAVRLHGAPWFLTGRKIAIGQVEIGRPSQFGVDKAAGKSELLLGVRGTFDRDAPAEADLNVDNHATMVAAVMIGRDKRLGGVAPEARLYASAVGVDTVRQPQECLASQHVALQNSGDVRAINFSFGEPLQSSPRQKATLDGSSLLTLCVDWSARVHDTLYTIAGNQGAGGIPIPTDQFNGITVAYTSRRDDRFDKLDFSNLSTQPQGIGRRLIAREINTGPRRAVSLVAPGGRLQIPELEGRVTEVSGTSFAAPHVTATVALLQEYGDRQYRQLQSPESSREPAWSLDARRHEVMKAVLLNSAEKLQGALGVQRTIFGLRDKHTWRQSDALASAAIPLDMQLGAGQLNAYRAYQQFSAGQQSPQAPVAPLGWDYNRVEAGSARDYELEGSLEAGSFVAVTLAWDRRVELDDRNGNDRFDAGESFRDRGLNDLNAFLLPVEGDRDRRADCASTSAVDSVEHIFCQVPRSGRYKIRVRYSRQAHEALQPYGLAWWTGSGSTRTALNVQ